MTVCFRATGGSFIELRIQKRHRGIVTGSFITAEQLELFVRREIGGQPIRVAQLPAADETIVTGVALQIDPQKNLRAVLRRLQGTRLARADITPPVHSNEK